ncbi:ABC transporter permease [Coralloluteibacterium stylophorae]|uniref:ABC transporter permease n=1 Tax=Coralloluteibacterium stylophorae TaxID=1776034 RepID=A0A8J7VS93_9GAMM|nr:ABC transporter permease [Coralloluteibacterium stylophorae]MBS7458232.1 ABC transporter permease [Coralloluteibacterium stylophorae]
MKYLHLIWANLFRRKVRTILTLLSIAVAFLLFGLLQTVNQAFAGAGDAAAADRLVTSSRFSIVDLLPVSYLDRIRQVPGVRNVAHATWFGGAYQDTPAAFAIFPVVPEDYLDVVPEMKLPAEQMEAWQATRTGAIVGQALADKYGWSIGDRIPVRADIWPLKDGSNAWEFDLVGIYTDPETPANENSLLFRYDFFDEARQFGSGRVGWFSVAVDDPGQADAVAQSIDALFANSESETKTQTERAWAQGFVKQIGDIGLIVTSILGAVFFTLVVLTGNTMAQALRERIPELGILKTLGFRNESVLGFVLAEAVLMLVVGGAIGLGLAWLALQVLKASMSQFGITGMQPDVLLQGLVLMLVTALVVGAIPAIQAMRLKIVDALNA